MDKRKDLNDDISKKKKKKKHKHHHHHHKHKKHSTTDKPERFVLQFCIKFEFWSSISYFKNWAGCMLFFVLFCRKQHKKRKHRKGNENGVVPRVNDNKKPDKPKENISVKISAGSSKREVKEEVKVKSNEKRVSNCRDTHSSVVLNGNGAIMATENHKEVQKSLKKIEPEQKKTEPAEGTKFPVDESSESEVDAKAKESDSDIEVAVIEDDIDLEDLMRQKVSRSLYGTVFLAVAPSSFDLCLEECVEENIWIEEG
jgi:hypothetical protein